MQGVLDARTRIKDRRNKNKKNKNNRHNAEEEIEYRQQRSVTDVESHVHINYYYHYYLILRVWYYPSIDLSIQLAGPIIVLPFLQKVTNLLHVLLGLCICRTTSLALHT